MSDRRQWVYFFDDPVLDGAGDPKALLGGKGASLAEMTRSGLNVPPGFTITTEACRHVLDHNGQWPEGLEGQVRESLGRLETATGRVFGRGAKPLLVSVRSGAAVSMPGMMDTILNCGIHPGLADEVGDTSNFWQPFVQFIKMFAHTVGDLESGSFPRSQQASRQAAEEHLGAYEKGAGRPFPLNPWDQLVECINAVFRSWNNERAIAYRERHNIRGLPGTAVNVQAMFPSRVSGILFTHDPSDVESDQMVLEASFGLGEAVVSGDVSPDRFRVQREGGAIVESSVGKKSHAIVALGDSLDFDREAPCLDPAQVAELCALGRRIEKHFCAPMDIEWGWGDGRFAMLQCRPIRGLEIARDVEAGRREEIERLRALSADRPRVWVIHNLSETLPNPTPLTWDIIRQFMSGAGGFGGMYRDLGYRPSEEVCQRGFLELICGCIYADPERVAQLFWDAMPLTYDREAILKDKSQLDRAPTQFDPERVDAGFLVKLPAMIRAMMRNVKVLKQLSANAKIYFEDTILPPYLAYLKEKRNQDLSALSTDEVIHELHGRLARIMDDFGKESLKPPFFGGIAFDALEAMLVQLMGKEEGTRLSSILTMGLEGDVTFDQDALLSRVAAGEVPMQEFLDCYGHRAAGEMELAEPRWREDTTYLERIVEQIQKSDGRSMADRHRENAGRREEAQAGLPKALAEWGGSCFREEIEANLRDAQEMLPYRETGKHYLMMGYEVIRTAILELSRRWGLDGDVFYLRLDELDAFESRREELAGEIEARKIRWQAFQRLDLPDVIDSTDLDGLGLAPALEASNELTGDPVAPGVSVGPARVVMNPSETGDMGFGYILVCPSTDPGWTPLFLNARGLIVERGGILSHGAIVARDFGIPAAVCPNATKQIQSGDTVRLDGNNGHISILEGSRNA